MILKCLRAKACLLTRSVIRLMLLVVGDSPSTHFLVQSLQTNGAHTTPARYDVTNSAGSCAVRVDSSLQKLCVILLRLSFCEAVAVHALPWGLWE
jgi:hypothetical protein